MRLRAGIHWKHAQRCAAEPVQDCNLSCWKCRWSGLFLWSLLVCKLAFWCKRCIKPAENYNLLLTSP